tara:strand:+ start:729 stop:896 length:168 start_codon:yes stop_codon:yes gene_type:complete
MRNESHKTYQVVFVITKGQTLSSNKYGKEVFNAFNAVFPEIHKVSNSIVMRGSPG